MAANFWFNRNITLMDHSWPDKSNHTPHHQRNRGSKFTRFALPIYQIAQTCRRRYRSKFRTIIRPGQLDPNQEVSRLYEPYTRMDRGRIQGFEFLTTRSYEALSSRTEPDDTGIIGACLNRGHCRSTQAIPPPISPPKIQPPSMSVT